MLNYQRVFKASFMLVGGWKIVQGPHAGKNDRDGTSRALLGSAKTAAG